MLEKATAEDLREPRPSNRTKKKTCARGVVTYTMGSPGSRCGDEQDSRNEQLKSQGWLSVLPVRLDRTAK